MTRIMSPCQRVILQNDERYFMSNRWEIQAFSDAMCHLAGNVRFLFRSRATLGLSRNSMSQGFIKEIAMKHFCLSTLLYIALLFVLVACQPVTRRPELPTLSEHKISTHSAHAGGIKVGPDGALWFTHCNEEGALPTNLNV